MSPRVAIVCAAGFLCAANPAVGAWVLAVCMLGIVISYIIGAVVRSFHE